MSEALVAVPATAGADVFPRLLTREVRNLTLQELCNAYMAQYTGQDRSRPRILRAWLALLGADRLAHEISARDIAQAINYLASTPARRYVGGCKPAGQMKDLTDKNGRPLYRQGPTLNRYRAGLGALLTFARKRLLMPEGWNSPIKDVAAYKENSGRTGYLTREQLDKLLAVSKASSWERLWLLVAMAVTTGARRGELLSLRWQDINLDAATAHIRASKSKNSDERTLVLVASVVAEIKRLVKPEHPNELLFRGRWNPLKPMNFDKPWQAAMVATGIKNFTFHGLRHTCASHAAQAGASAVELADLLGHRQMQMVRRYSHLNTATKARLVARVFGDVGSANG